MGARFVPFVVVCVLVLALGCKKKAESTADVPPAAPTEAAPAPAPTPDTAPTPAPVAAPAPPEAPPAAAAQDAAPLEVESRAILSREPVTQAAQVQHVLIGWSDLSQAHDPRAMARTKDEADRLALQILDQIKSGKNMAALMAEYSEDPGSAQSGDPYPVRPDGTYVPEFEALALRLNVGEAGICRTVFGYHIMKRVQ